MLHSWDFKIILFCLILINRPILKMQCIQFVHSVENVALQDQLYTQQYNYHSLLTNVP